MILSEINSTDSCSILVSKNKSKMLKAPVARQGGFRLELDYNSEYILVFNKRGHQSKTIVVNTEMPENTVQEPADSRRFLMTVKLYSNDEAPENLYPGYQIQYISYFPETDSFARVSGVPGYEYVAKSLSNRATNQKQPVKIKPQNFQVF